MLTSIAMSKKEYIERMHRMFTYYGFTECPLSLSRLSWMYDTNVSEVRAYRIGCDVAAGFRFLQSVAENV